MRASLQKCSDNFKIHPNSERLIQCPYCPQKYLLLWDDRKWNSVKDWLGPRRALFPRIRKTKLTSPASSVIYSHQGRPTHVDLPGPPLRCPPPH
jgi:hypothetical protein